MKERDSAGGLGKKEERESWRTSYVFEVVSGRVNDLSGMSGCVSIVRV